MPAISANRPARRALRAATFAAMCGAALVATTPPGFAAQAPRATKAHWARHETIEQRISSLHASLKITAAEETPWAGVAQTMRDNDAAMHTLEVEQGAVPADSVTAVDDLKAYQKFGEAHVAGLAKLLTAFETLYTAMPDEQKHVADKVFATFGHKSMHA